MKVREWKGDVVFLHEVAEGAADRSYGVQVARLAGLPEPVLRRARQILTAIWSSSLPGDGASVLDDLPLFAQAAPPRSTRRLRTIRSLALLDASRPDDLTPRQAIDLIYEMKKARDADSPKTEVRSRIAEFLDPEPPRRSLPACCSELGEESPKSAQARDVLLAHVKTLWPPPAPSAEAELLATGTRHALRPQSVAAPRTRSSAPSIMFATRHVYPVDNPSEAETLAVAAVGGYGRATLAPGSDIDLLFILPYKQTPWGEQVTEYMLYMLWDLGQKVGHAVRSVDECLRMAKADMTVRTATLEARYLCRRRIAVRQAGRSASRPRSCLKERARIHRRQDGRARRAPRADGQYPLCRRAQYQGRQGRAARPQHPVLDRQILLSHHAPVPGWSTRACSRAAEYRLFERAEDFLWAVRCNLHFLTGRADEKLTFDLQPDLARRLRLRRPARHARPSSAS